MSIWWRVISSSCFYVGLKVCLFFFSCLFLIRKLSFWRVRLTLLFLITHVNEQVRYHTSVRLFHRTLNRQITNPHLLYMHINEEVKSLRFCYFIANFQNIIYKIFSRKEIYKEYVPAIPPTKSMSASRDCMLLLSW